jgi:hypothetical protein
MSDICERISRKDAIRKFSRKDAKAQRSAFASLREKKLPVVILKLNRISIVQECDATMVKKEQMPGTRYQ